MSAEDTEPSETGVEDAGCDDDEVEGLEVGFPPSLAAGGLSVLVEVDVGTIGTTEEDFGS